MFSFFTNISTLSTGTVRFNVRTFLNETADQQWRQSGQQSANSCQPSQLFEDVRRSRTSGQLASGRRRTSPACTSSGHVRFWSIVHPLAVKGGTRGYCYCPLPIFLSRGLQSKKCSNCCCSVQGVRKVLEHILIICQWLSVSEIGLGNALGYLELTFIILWKRFLNNNLHFRHIKKCLRFDPVLFEQPV